MLVARTMPSFDIVSKLDLAEVDNALNQATKELGQRYDFKGTDTKLTRAEKVLTLESADEYKLKAAYDVLQSKLVKRGVSLKSLKENKIEPASKGRARQTFDLLDGIDGEKSKELVKKIKDSKLKVQASYQDQQVRVTGKKKDDLQEAIALVKGMDFSLPLQFMNFRD
jgi:cyclic-di-GMP-binding protein